MYKNKKNLQKINKKVIKYLYINFCSKNICILIIKYFT